MVAVPQPEPPDAPEAAEQDADTIGKKDEVLRAFNFSGGGFNTVMQVGVIHALLVTQGRAPDIVVGVSAGSIQAVALAEIMRKGSVPEKCEKAEYETVLNERVACLRRVVDACHRAPEDLVDALLPDAYQIESFDPLAPLLQPTLAAAEREERQKWLIGKAGLARLYNELLGIDIPVGVVAHLVRRFLGFRAVGNIGRDDGLGAWRRFLAYVSETMKLLLVFSEHVTRFAPLAAMLVTPMLDHLYGKSAHTAQRDAESIMSRFGIVDRVTRFKRDLLAFLLVLNAWLLLSLSLLTPLVVVVSQLVVDDFEVSPWWLALAVVVLTLILSPLWPTLVRWDLKAARRVSWTIAKGVTVFVWNSAKWLLVTLALTAIPVALLATVTRLSWVNPDDLWPYLAAFAIALLLGWLAAMARFVWHLARRPGDFRMLLLTAIAVALLAAFGSGSAVIPGALQGFFAVFNIVLLGVLLGGLIKLGLDVARGSKDLRQLALQTGRATAVALGLASLWFVMWVVTLGVDEALPPLLGFLGFDPILDGLLAFVGEPPAEPAPIDPRLVALESAARADMMTWTQRAVFDVLIGMLVVALSLAVSVVLILGVVAWIVLSFWFRHDRTVGFSAWFMRRFLKRYAIGASLANGYPLKHFLIQLFDPGYYGEPDLVEAANAALSDTRAAEPAAGNHVPVPKRIGDYARHEKGRPVIRLALAAADVRTGLLDVVPAKHGVVDALMAALAFPPILPPVEIDGALYSDAINIGNVPSRALLRLMRRSNVADISAIHVYAVDPLPVSQERLSAPVDTDGDPKTTPYLNLIDTASRALQLQRFRDAKVERRLTRVFTELLPEGKGSVEVVDREGGKKKFFRAYIAPVELDRAIDLNAQILYAPKETRRAELAETIAMGCRAALQVMLADTLSAHAAEVEASGKPRPLTVGCSKAVALYKTNNGGNHEIRLPGMTLGAPGLAEICKNCSIKNEFGKVTANRSLRILGSEVPPQITDWPQERQWSDPLPRPPVTRVEANEYGDVPENAAEAVTQEQTGPIDSARACLFGGGVFRGVFQMGVINALALVKFRPTLVAGASVGSITAAMAAVVLDKSAEETQPKSLAALASVFLSIDRLVLTDRFSDFVRTWTIRASEARFSIREADRVFRKYDFDAAPVFQRTFRAVVAGLERLFYVNPYQLNRIVSAARHRQVHDLVDQLKDCAQGWLDRMHVGTEVLGAEPLRQLIEQFVVAKIAQQQERQAVSLDALSKNSKLLATTTNLTQGALRVLGSWHDNNAQPVKITLIETLLASSAFPGVFRPRRSWDLLPGDNAEDEYVDGGIVDNLPIEPVLQELRAQAEKEKKLDLRPTHPHLLVAASLEPRYEPLSEEDAKALKHHWPEVRTRLRELQYNVKLNMYKYGLADVTTVYDAVGKASPRVPLHVKLIAVEPEWLCSTFAFHPMLGFRRAHQAKSIAHGCASTLGAFSEIRADAHANWGLEEAAIPEHSLAVANARPRPSDDVYNAGKCWLVPKTTCPFSRQGQGASKLEDSKHWVSEIHRYCWDANTHKRDQWRNRCERPPAVETPPT